MMRHAKHLLSRRLKAIALLAILAMAAPGCKRNSAESPPTRAPAKTQATTAAAPATRPVAASQPIAPRTFVQLVKLHYPDFPATQPLESPLDRKDAARIILRDPIYLDRLGNLWITRDDAEPTQAVLSKAADEVEHFVRQRPVYAHWRYEPGVRRQPGHSTPVLVCPAADGEQIEFIEEKRRQTLTVQREGYQWSAAFSWNDDIVVGTSTGASIFARTDNGWSEIPSPPLIDEKKPHAPTQVPVESVGLLAYVPAEGGSPGSPTVARFVDGKWLLLQDKTRWPGNFLHLVPLADGSVLQLISGDQGRVRIAITDFDTTRIDRKRVMQLIEQLDDSDRRKQDEAFAQLSTYGSGLWPILEKEMDNQPAGVREKMAVLLRNKTEPTIGEMTLVDSELKLAGRSDDGGALFYSRGGVSVTNIDGDQTLAQPAWISIRPGQPIHLMVGPAWNDLTLGKRRFYGVEGGDWIVSDDVVGPREIIGSFDLVPILRKKDAKYSELIGIDQHKRWLFREPGDAGKQFDETLILDPTLPPVTPQLPVWQFVAAGGKAGCDQHDWPAYQDRGGNVWIIGENGFELLDKEKNKFIDDPAALAALPRASNPTAVRVIRSPATTKATTLASSRATSLPATNEAAPPLLILSDGTRYYGGQTSLRRIAPDGTVLDWPLPSTAEGSAKPWLAIDRDGRLFLFNEPGRLIRLRATPAEAEPFKVDATFSHGIPNSDPSRIWLDPAGRIVIAHDGNQLAICFPAGIVPKTIADMMPANARDEAEE